jgi:DNA-binding winged helix-turn-helix (wHTH) protein
MPTAKPPEKFQFGDFELDTGAYELRREGKPIRLERQPMDLLTLLVERGSQLVTRSDIVNRLWGEGVFVDVEMGINTAIRKIRHALHDSPANSTFIETVPGKGYRFIVKVEVGRDHGTVSAPIIIGVLPFENLSADTAREYLADGLTEEVIASLGQIDPGHLGVIGRT